MNLKNARMTISLIGLIGIAVIAYIWATSLIASLYAYRSPFADNPLPPSQQIGKPISRQVVAILVDGLRVDTAANAKVMPFLNQLRASSAHATMHSSTPSYSSPGWSTLLIGGWPEIHGGPAMNPPVGLSAKKWTQDNIFAAVRRAGLETSLAGSYFFTQMIPAAHLSQSRIVFDETHIGDTENATNAVAFIQSGKYHFNFVHLVQVDHAGHLEGGPRAPHWNQAASRADEHIRQIVSAMDLSQDTVLIFSDHGQIDQGGHGGHESIVLTEPFIMTGANVKPGHYADIYQIDVAPTIAALLGTNIPAPAQGHILSHMLVLNEARLAAIRSASAQQQEVLYKAYAIAMGSEAQTIKLAENENPVSLYQAAMQAIKSSRQTKERLLRFLLAGLLVIVPAYFFYKQRRRTVMCFLACIGVYLAAFHGQYAILQERTYSLSSVLSSQDIISAAAINTTIAFLIAGFVLRLILREPFKTPRQATNTHIAFTLSLLYMLALPALWSFAYNGAVATWMLPELGSLFMGFIAILQMLVVAVLGLIFTGLTPLSVFILTGKRNARTTINPLAT